MSTLSEYEMQELKSGYRLQHDHGQEDVYLRVLLHF